LNKSLFLRQGPLLHCSSHVNVLEEHSLKVPSFGGTLWVKFPYNVHVQPTNTMDFPNLDQAFLKVLSSDGQSDVKLNIVQDGLKLSIAGTGDGEDLGDVSLHVEVPIVYAVNVITSGEGAISCRDMIESDQCHLTSEHGDILVTGVKTQNLVIQSETGDIRCRGAIQGSVRIASGDGDVVSDKRFLGPSLDISTDNGDINVSSCYSDQSKFSSQTGHMDLRNVHNDSYVAVYEEGDVKMTGLDGTANIFMKKGNLDVQISHVGTESRIHVEEGDINLKMADNHPLKLCVTGTEVVTDDTFAKYGDIDTKEDDHKHYFGRVQPDQFSPLCQVLADSGKVTISAQGWAQSLGLKLK